MSEPGLSPTSGIPAPEAVHRWPSQISTRACSLGGPSSLPPKKPTLRQLPVGSHVAVPTDPSGNPVPYCGSHEEPVQVSSSVWVPLGVEAAPPAAHSFGLPQDRPKRRWLSVAWSCGMGAGALVHVPPEYDAK